MHRMRWLLLTLLLLSGGQGRAQTLLAAGPMVGYSSADEVMLWVQTTVPAKVVYRWWPEKTDGEEKSLARISNPVASDREKDCCVHVRLTDLPPGKVFQYELYLNGRLVERPYPLRFVTQALWQKRADPPDFTVALGSCAHINDPAFDRPGKPYGGDPAIFQSMARDRPDVMIWLGDNLYYRESDWTSRSGMRRRYRTNRGHAALQALLGSVHHYAIWDDHDYGPNDSDRSFVLKDVSLRTFRLYWANPSYGLGRTPGVFTRFSWGDVDFFLLDNRYHRSPNNSLPVSERTMFGDAQLQWLIDGLTSSRATFKVVAGGNQMLNPLTLYEALGNFPSDHKRLLDAITRQRTEGVFFLSGDRHHTELVRLMSPQAYPLYDYTSSPLLSRVHKAEREQVNTARVPGTLVTDHRNYGLLRFQGPRKSRTVTFECRDEVGKKLWSHQVKAADLRFSGR